MSQIISCDFTGCKNKPKKECTCGGRFKLCLDHANTHFITCKSKIIPYEMQENLHIENLELLNRTIEKHRKDIIIKTQSMIEYIQKCSYILISNLKKYAKIVKDNIKDNSPESEIKDFFENIPKLYDNLKLYSRFENNTSMILSFNNHIGFKDVQDYENEIFELKEKINKLENGIAKGHRGHIKRNSNQQIKDFEENFFENQYKFESSKSFAMRFKKDQGEFMDRRIPAGKEGIFNKSHMVGEYNEISKPFVAKVEIAVRAFKYILLSEKILWLNSQYKNLMALQEVEDVRLSKDYKYIFVCNQ
ncbi:hypothetical protein SteCoe_29431 [Stentor coeruleus]|uniref:Uncharacterized protein n=1 Tax=Stentor coeruleus TaxID=5963 RepID=A0A1R2B612_9CILI|nr:hypothetical protein SteCoe_29431 [Stentor coeruleus]